MNSLFGMPMDSVMRVLLALFLLATCTVAVLAFRNRLFLKLGLRNIPRRRAQTGLIIFGLMLSTVIITSAFGTGDTISYTIRSDAVSGLAAIDEVVTPSTAGTAEGAGSGGFFSVTIAGRIAHGVTPASDLDGVTGAIVQPVPLVDATSRQAKAAVGLLAVPAAYPAAFGTLTTADGATATLDALGPREVYLNQYAADALNAKRGDTLVLYLANKPWRVTVRDVLQNQGLAAGGLTPRVNYELLLPLSRAQAMAGRPGQISVVLVSNRGDAISGATLSDQVTPQIRALLVNPARLAATATLLRSPAGAAALHALANDHTVAPATRAKLANLEGALIAPGAQTTLATLLTDGDVANALETIKAPAVGPALTADLTLISDYTVAPVKQDGLTNADLYGSELTSVFIIFGMFSIAAGVMLIFLIFVMLATERRAEMGMARAVGTKRRHLIQQFLFEGYAYDLGAALVGTILGIVVGLAVVTVMAVIFGAFGGSLQRHVEPRSVVVAFCLGALVTFLTVAISSWRVSRLNVVAAIRDLPEDLRLAGSVGAAFRRPLTDLTRAARRLRRGNVLGALVSLLAAPWHLITAFRVFISRGPLLLVLGMLLYNLGVADKDAFPYTLGISLGLVGAALSLRWILGGLGVPDRLRNRIGFSLAGISLVGFWLLPFDTFRSDLNVDINMFFLSGMMLMLGGIWTVMYNADLLLGAFLRLGGGLGRLAPVVRMAVSYPLQQRFRTGMTLFMFSLVIFSLMVESAIIGSYGSRGLDINRSNGGYQIWGRGAPINPIKNVQAQVAADPTLRGRITASAALAQIGVGLAQPGQSGTDLHPGYRAAVVDDAYLADTRFPLHARAAGYASDAQVWEALRAHPGYAIVSAGLVPPPSGAASGFAISAIPYKTTRFQPVHSQMQDLRTGTMISLTVIGVLDDLSQTAAGTGSDLFTGPQTLIAAHDAPATPNLYLFRVAPGQDVHQAALALGTAFLPNGLDVKEARVVYNQSLSAEVTFNDLLEGFMALGLVVGIAALGVIATRSVVERRQQIGMLRALGFRRAMVRNAFLLESGIVAITGTLIGTVLGLLLARQVIAYFAKNDPGLAFVVPWPQVLLIGLGAYAASLLTTYLPARQASRVFPAEALRFE